MFEGRGRLALEGDHLDISYRRPDTWPNMTPGGSIKAHTFNLGDPEAGPNIQLGIMSTVDGERLDWPHSIDPPHHHGSDQFRVISQGEWTLAGKRQSAGEYSFQEAGRIYREHPPEGASAWMLLVMGDKRGTESTLAVEKDKQTLFDSGEMFGVPVEGRPYPHPAGNKGIAAIMTTAGACRDGYLRGKIAALAEDGIDGALTGVLGDAEIGPIVHVLKIAPGGIAVAACRYDTEVLLLAVSGTCTIGGKEYRSGEMRIQRAAVLMDDVVAGPGGLEAVLVVADRRVRPKMRDGDHAAPTWTRQTQQVLQRLKPAASEIPA